MQRITHILRKPAFVQYIIRQNYREPVKLTGMGDFEQFSLEVQIFPYGDKQKLVLSQDISQIEKTDAMRRDFVANVSHELKTPLTVLAGFLETVTELDLNQEERDRYLEMMSVQTGRMKTLVEDLLTLSRLEGSPLPGNRDWVAVHPLFVKCQQEAQALSERLHPSHAGAQKLVFDMPDDCLCDEVAGSATELHSAFSNLISNAIRYTPAGGQINVKWQRAADTAVFSVADTGPGIAPEQIGRAHV